MNLQSKIKKNITNLPYEGQEVDMDGMEQTIEDLLRRMITFAHTFMKTDKGYEKDGKYYSRDEIVQMFESEML